MASCFFLTRNTVDMYKITKTVIFSRAWEFGFSMSPRDMYYQFYKNAPAWRLQICSVGNDALCVKCDNISVPKRKLYGYKMVCFEFGMF